MANPQIFELNFELAGVWNEIMLYYASQGLC